MPQVRGQGRGYILALSYVSNPFFRKTPICHYQTTRGGGLGGQRERGHVPEGQQVVPSGKPACVAFRNSSH